MAVAGWLPHSAAPRATAQVIVTRNVPEVRAFTGTLQLDAGCVTFPESGFSGWRGASVADRYVNHHPGKPVLIFAVCLGRVGRKLCSLSGGRRAIKIVDCRDGHRGGFESIAVDGFQLTSFDTANGLSCALPRETVPLRHGTLSAP